MSPLLYAKIQDWKFDRARLESAYELLDRVKRQIGQTKGLLLSGKVTHGTSVDSLASELRRLDNARRDLVEFISAATSHEIARLNDLAERARTEVYS